MKAWHLVLGALAVYLVFHYWSTITVAVHPANLTDAAGGQNDPRSNVQISQQGYR